MSSRGFPVSLKEERKEIGVGKSIYLIPYYSINLGCDNRYLLPSTPPGRPYPVLVSS